MLRMSRLSSDDGLALLGIARRAISSAVLENRLPDFPPFPSEFSVRRGAFVTLHRGGKLRGCVGQVEDPEPLAEGVVRAAINAALHDPRFPPVAVEEVAALEIEISVLSPLETIAPDAILAGQHGVLVVRPHTEDYCFRRSPRSGDGPASDCWKKPVPRLVWLGMLGGIPQLKCLPSPRKFFQKRKSEQFPICEISIG